MKKMKLAGIALLSVFLITGCGKKDGDQTEEQSEKKPAVTQDMESTEGETNNPNKEDQSDAENTYSDTESQEEERAVKIYYIDDATAETVSENVIIEDENDIWSALQEKGILTDDCKLLNFELDQKSRQIDLDFNAALGERIRSFGTTGETEIIGCLVNTYLNAYECDGIRLTEEGAPLKTSSGANFDGYTGKMEI